MHMLSSFSEGGLFPTTEAKPKPNSKQNKTKTTPTTIKPQGDFCDAS